MSRKVTLAAPYTDRGGKSYKADETVELPDGVASRLLHEGLAREPKSDGKKSSAPKTSEKGA